MQIKIVGHYDSPDNPHGLEEDPGVAALTPGEKHPLEHLDPFRLGDDVFVAEGYSHHGYQQTEEDLELTQAVLI